MKGREGDSHTEVKGKVGDSLTLKSHRRDGPCVVGWEVPGNKRLLF